MNKLRWGILGSGNIAREMAKAMLRSKTATLAMVASQHAHAGLTEFFPGAQIVDDYEAAVESNEIDAIYVAIPHHLHAQWAISCCEGKKHVLCEKPLAVNLAEAQLVVEAAHRNHVFLGEGLMYRMQSLTVKMLELLRDGVIGQIQTIASSIGTNPNLNADHWLRHPATAGGAILDVGIYPISVARLIGGVASGVPYAEPTTVRGVGELSNTGVDERASALLHFESGIIAEIGCSMSSYRPVSLVVFGTHGRLEVPEFWSGSGKYGGTGKLNIFPQSNHAYTLEIHEQRWLFEVELDAVAKAVSRFRTEFEYPSMTWADSLGNTQVLDRWRREVGIQYPFERDG